jgi:hypothetical protein
MKVSRESMPKFGLQTDTFGHSLTNAWLYKKAGYKMLLMTRVSDFHRMEMRDSHNLAFNWLLPHFEKKESLYSVFTMAMYGDN